MGNGRGFYTSDGLKKLASIVREARGDRSYREFEAITGVSHGVIRRIEILDAKMPDWGTLQKLAHPNTPFTALQLQAIAMQQEDLVDKVEQKFWRAEDVIDVVRDLPDQEIGRLAKMLVDLLVQGNIDNNNKSD